MGTRERIMAGCGQVLRRPPPDPVRDVLGVAGVSRRTFYQHFDNLEAVAEAIYRDTMQRMLTQLVTAIREVDPEHRVETAVRAYLAFHRQEGPLLAVLMSESMSPHSKLAQMRREALSGFDVTFGRMMHKTRGYRLDGLMIRALFTGLGTIVTEANWGKLDGEDGERLARVMQAMILTVFDAGERFEAVRITGEVAPPDA